MKDNDTKRLSILVVILTQLQTRRLVTSTKLAEKFGVSTRTIYRDLKALEQAGVPILTEDGECLCFESEMGFVIFAKTGWSRDVLVPLFSHGMQKEYPVWAMQFR